MRMGSRTKNRATEAEGSLAGNTWVDFFLEFFRERRRSIARSRPSFYSIRSK